MISHHLLSPKLYLLLYLQNSFEVIDESFLLACASRLSHVHLASKDRQYYCSNCNHYPNQALAHLPFIVLTSSASESVDPGFEPCSYK